MSSSSLYINYNKVRSAMITLRFECGSAQNNQLVTIKPFCKSTLLCISITYRNGGVRLREESIIIEINE